MDPSKAEWLELLAATMDRWRKAQRVLLQRGKDALNKYLDSTDCPLCKRTNYVCADCIVTEIMGKRCQNVDSFHQYLKLVDARGPEAIAEAIRLMFIDMNSMYDKLEGGDTDEVVNDGEAT